MEVILLTQKEKQRESIIEELVKGEISIEESACMLNLSERHVLRLKAGYLKDGSRYLVHGNTSRKPPHAIDENLKDEVVKLASQKYNGCNYHQITDLLYKYDKILLSVSTVRRILKSAGIESSGKKGRAAGKSSSTGNKDREYEEGNKVYIDYRTELWHGLRLPKAMLVMGVDYLTGRILSAIMGDENDDECYFNLMDKIASEFGVPGYVCGDSGIFIANNYILSTGNELDGRFFKYTPFARKLENMDIGVMCSDMADDDFSIDEVWKRVRNWLIYELAIRNIKNMENTNTFLDSFVRQYNSKYGIDGSSSRRTASGY
jgi:transposase